MPRRQDFGSRRRVSGGHGTRSGGRHAQRSGRVRHAHPTVVAFLAEDNTF